MSSKMISKVEGQTLVLERVFDATREQVFQAFSTAEHLTEWWGPNGWTLTVCNIDFRPEGIWHYCMKCIDPAQGDFYGYESWGKAIYHEIEPNQKIVYTDYFSDADSNEVEGMPPSHITMLFADQDGQTQLISHSRFESVEALQQVIEMGVEQGIRETWDRLEAYLQSL